MEKLLALTIGGQKIPVPDGIKTGGLESGGAGQKVLQFGVSAFLFTAALLSVIMIMYGGIRWITSGGDKTKIQTARSTVTYAIIGLVIVMTAFLIITILGKVLGFPLLYIPGGATGK